MPDQESPASAVLEALGSALFVREESGALRLSGSAPEWLRRLWPTVASPDADLPLAEASPFLENFLVDAGECWAAGGSNRAQSGPWIEHDADGAELQLEATALTAGGRPVLLVERLGEAFETKKAVLQKARETAIAHQRLNAEMQKKEILLHCLAEDMSAALGNAVTSLRLMELEQDPTKIRHLLGLAARATEQQQNLIGKVLEVFADELDGLYGRSGETPAAADLHAVLRRAVDAAAPQFSEKGVRLESPVAATRALRVAADAGHLERVLVNLLENALDHTPAGSNVAVRLEDEPESVTVQVSDGSAKIPLGVRAKLFAKFETSSESSPAALLRLHFCRIAVENWNGEIGHTPLEGRGNCFWIRLPKPVTAR
jgi:signal transduction histidine kinase